MNGKRGYLKISIALIGLILFVSTLPGQEVWQSTQGPEGSGTVDPVMAIDPSSGDWYIIVQGLLYRSANQGQDWVPVPGPSGSILNAHICITTNGYLLIGVQKQIYRTSDQGKNWETINASINNFITSLYYDSKSGYVLAGIYQEGIIRSLDEGATWAPVNTGLSNITEIGQWCFYVHSDGKLYTGGYAAAPNGGVYVSTTKGASWTNINGDISPAYVYDISVNSTGHIFFASAGDYVYRSINDGTNWTRITTLGDLRYCMSILILPNDDIFIGTSQRGIFTSPDNGSTWNPISLTPGDVEVREMLYDTNVSRIVTACYGTGVLVGSSGGSFWRYYNNGLYHAPVSGLALTSRLYASGYGLGIWRLEGMTWENITYNLGSLKTTIVTTGSGYIYTGTMFNGLYRLPETGTEWTDITTGLTHTQVTFVYSAADGTLYAQTGTVYHFHRSLDNGATWSDLFSGDYKSAVQCMIGKTSHGFYFAGTVGNGILRSTDGINFSPVNNGLTSLAVYCLTKSVDHSTVFAGTDDGLYQSANDGDTWEKLTNVPLGGTVVTVAVNSADHIFIADQTRGVYVSKDGGETWNGFNGGLPVLNIRKLIPDGENYLYAATEAGGVYRTIRSTTALTAFFSVHMKNEIGFDPAEDAVYLRGNFSGWPAGDPIAMSPLNDAEMTYVASWTTNRPDTVLSGKMMGEVIFWYSYYDQSLGSEMEELVSNLTRTVNWEANDDLTTPSVWFGNQELFSRDFIKPNYVNYGNSRGVAWGDYDGDDNLDFIVANSGTLNFLYHNQGDGQFVRFNDDPFASDIHDATTPVWGDIDNDGDIDLFVANNGISGSENNLFYRNNGNQTFSRMVGQSLVTDAEYSTCASWADYDRNGFLDLIVVNQGGLNALYKNLGDGSFDRIGVSPFSVDQGMSRGCSWADYDNDGDLDLFIANAGSDPGEFNFLYENLGDGQFNKITSENPVVTDKGMSYGGCWGDYNNDGLLDLYVVNGGGQANVLYINQGDGNFIKAPDTLPICEPSDSRGASWVDFNNDGWLDLLVINFFDFSDEGYRNILYQNLSDGNFMKIGTGPIYIDSGDKSGHAWADYDRDGDPDLIITNPDDVATILYRNNTENNNWLQVSLEGVTSNRQGIGARVVVKSGNFAQMRDIGSGNTGQGQNEPIAHFGLGGLESIDSLIVIWPNASTGRRVYPAPNVNQRIHLVEILPDLPLTVLIKPDSLAVDVDLFPNFVWHKTSGDIVAYDLQVSGFSDFRELIVNQIDILDTTYQYPTNYAPFPSATQLFWHVKAKDSNGNGNWSNTWAFKTQRGISSVQALDVIAPVKGATGVTLPVNLSWMDTTGYVGSITYDVQVSPIATFPDTNFAAYDLTTASVTIEGLNYNTTYYWRACMKTSSTIYHWNDPPWSFTTEAGTKPVAPALLNPPNDATDVAEYVLLTWNAVQNGVYRVRISELASLSNPVYDFQDLADPYYYVPDLNPGTKYFWGVNVTVSGLESDVSAVRSFTTRPQTITVSQTLSFPTKEHRDAFTSQDYILFGLPGNVNIALDNPAIFGPDFGVKWMAYWDNGQATDFYEPFNQEGKFKFLPGRGYWVIVNGSVQISDSPQNLAVDNQAEVEIDVHSGFNIITNPFTVDVAWTVVRAANGFVGTEPLYQYNKGFMQAVTMKPYQGYYFDNTNSSRDKLKIPYFSYLPKTNTQQLTDWQLNLELSDNVSRDETVTVGVSANAAAGLDELDFRCPRAPGEILQAYFYRPDWRDGYQYMAGDFRPPSESVEYWDLQVRTPNSGRVRIDAAGLASVPDACAIYLIDKTHGRHTDLRQAGSYEFDADVTCNDFILAAGDESEIKNTIRELILTDFALGRNFPNPFNPETTIPVTVPVRTDISLVIFDILGRQVKVLQKGEMFPGHHYIKWDGKDRAGNPAASGIYFYQLIVNHSRNFSGKMILMR